VFCGIIFIDLEPTVRLQESQPQRQRCSRLERFLKGGENIFVFKWHYIGYSWRCKLLQRWRCNSVTRHQRIGCRFCDTDSHTSIHTYQYLGPCGKHCQEHSSVSWSFTYLQMDTTTLLCQISVQRMLLRHLMWCYTCVRMRHLMWCYRYVCIAPNNPPLILYLLSRYL
jgi:hypothetical protein